MTDEPNTPTPTPRTDAELQKSSPEFEPFFIADFTRTLERELSTATEELRQLRTTETALRAFVALLRTALLTIGGREIVLHDAELKGNFGKQVTLDREGDYFVLRFDENPTTIEPLDHE